MSSDIVKKAIANLISEGWDAEAEAVRQRIEALEGEVAALKKTNAEWLKENAPGGWIDIFRSQAREYGARAERLRVALSLYEKAEKVGTSDAYEVAHNVRRIELEDDKP